MIQFIRDILPNKPPSPHTWIEQGAFWLGAISISIIAMLFAKVSTMGNNFFISIIQYSPYYALALIPAGFGAIVWITRRFFAGAEGSGIPQVIAVIDSPKSAEDTPILSLRIAFSKIVLTCLSLCFGASVGREGPTVQIGAAIMYGIGRIKGLSLEKMERTLILAGGASGIAAAFNTPLAGILFAIEELSRSFEERTSGIVLTTVIVSGFVSMAVWGNYTYFGRTDIALNLLQAWKPVLVCGVLGGLLGGAFSRLLILFSQTLPGRIGHLIGSHPVLFASFCGLGVAILGIASNSTIYGTGYEEARSLLEGTGDLPVWFCLMKLLATVLSYISGLAGGIFAPSLAVGAGMGQQIAHFMPQLPFASIVILGMVGYFSGVVQVPITSTIIVMEMTDDPSLRLPLLATAFIAYHTSRTICPTPLYRTLAQNFLAQTKKIDPEKEKAPPVLS